MFPDKVSEPLILLPCVRAEINADEKVDESGRSIGSYWMVYRTQFPTLRISGSGDSTE